MPTYNRQSVISEALNSVLIQTHKKFELIIIDDGSTDNTEEIIYKFAKNDSRLKYIKTTHSGAASARNTGIRSAKGKYIAYLDTDNIWYKNYLEITLSEFTDSVVLVYSAQNLILRDKLDSTAKTIAYSIRREEYNPFRITASNYIDLNSGIHLKNIINNTGTWNETLQRMSDWDFIARIISHYPYNIKFLDQVLSEYRYVLDQKETITGSYVSNEAILKKFKLSPSWGDKLKIKNRIEKMFFGIKPSL